MRAAWIALLMAVICGAWGASDPPIPAPTKESHPPKQPAHKEKRTANTEQRGTEERPLFIGIVGTPIVEVQGGPEAQQKPAENKEKNDDGTPHKWWLRPDALVAWFTFGLLLIGTITAAILICQSRLIARQLRLARDEFNAAHRPRIRIKHVWLTGEFWSGQSIFLSLVIVNTGDAAGKITDIRYGVSIIDADQTLPQKPVYPSRFPVERVAENIGLGRTFEFGNISTERIISDAENASVRENRSKLYVYGHVEYTEFANGSPQRLGSLKNTAFCRVLVCPKKPFSHNDMGRLVRHNDPDYEYED